MSLPDPKHPGYTLADLEQWEGHWELIDGVAYAMTAPSPTHQRVSFRLQKAMDVVLEESKRTSGGNCEIFNAPIALYLPGSQNVYLPDLVVVCDPSKITTRGIEGIPDLVVEILSPSTMGKDLTRKRWAYEAAGIPEYLLVDPEDHWGLLLILENGRYQEAARLEWGSIVSLLGGNVSIPLG